MSRFERTATDPMFVRQAAIQAARLRAARLRGTPTRKAAVRGTPTRKAAEDGEVRRKALEAKRKADEELIEQDGGAVDEELSLIHI